MSRLLGPDRVLYGESWRLRETSGDKLWLFDGQAHGLRLGDGPWPFRVHTFEIAQAQLTLRRLDQWGGDWLPALFGRPPEHRDDGPCNYAYTDLDAPIDFTGGLLLGAGACHQDPWEPDLEPGAWEDERVLELELDKGRLTASRDHSAALGELRTWVQQSRRQGARPTTAEICARVDAVTSRRYYEWLRG